MLDIDEMGSKEIHELLQRIEYGHLGCASEGHPYVVPMHYYFENPNLYIFTTEGMKTKYIDANPEVCLQVEEIHNLSHWRSVIIMGRAERLTEPQEFDHAMQLIKAHNPKLSPALNRTWIDVWGRANVIVIYRISPSEMTGRTTEGVSSQP
ncbi:Pyridoxamine 5'-phosphate oxidase-related, FMN-binding protein [Trichormus variabilis ATCC 29413]|uniref:Pyridoxamine 5'-phosphate oxidase-related, FMN-binding protein n=3 Tax=Nostocales TaxID=1161 RepID=Q3M6P1_TRIV2|nr:Pyridoxamine 5'-phosphate oxidase-related, FMN-binding protein [Trichormus variabilis ATCC 29413]MBC1214311.1 pyridoxamine 5'-phosphate oxidase family protein [Trichormus variabilis ARAD]MBC1254454.1 pyridoxamine 5'-phosphate oxidase family protein [Trichormus variabilis V5]MBC1268038.1 pyridoxamine 5'-phosphate oxidase family protein [Trichormus variabilis FSR]MBC1302886.1 pyridoxamine 5'-phosphate oxidase family protein [Trichormus variabilis N2B]MBC1310976.1 pyridoxamine 5'-phosphate oxi